MSDAVTLPILGTLSILPVTQHGRDDKTVPRFDFKFAPASDAVATRSKEDDWRLVSPLFDCLEDSQQLWNEPAVSRAASGDRSSGLEQWRQRVRAKSEKLNSVFAPLSEGALGLVHWKIYDDADDFNNEAPGTRISRLPEDESLPWNRVRVWVGSNNNLKASSRMYAPESAMEAYEEAMGSALPHEVLVGLSLTAVQRTKNGALGFVSTVIHGAFKDDRFPSRLPKTGAYPNDPEERQTLCANVGQGVVDRATSYLSQVHDELKDLTAAVYTSEALVGICDRFMNLAADRV